MEKLPYLFFMPDNSRCVIVNYTFPIIALHILIEPFCIFILFAMLAPGLQLSPNRML